MTRALAALLLLAASTSWATGRWALVVGENRGLADEETLRFAEADAVRVRDVLTQVGGVEPSHTVLLQGADAGRLRAAMAQLLASMEAERVTQGRAERLIVFVSSHAGDGVLHLNGTQFLLSELVAYLQAAPADVGVLVVDACRSGVMTRLKGLQPLAELPVKVEAATVKGRVLISASGADEYAQESEELRGSYFTHYLVSGLRGAADTSRDGRVTLEEAYTWAWTRTLDATFGSRAGIQRPAFKSELSGQGQLVLTELRSATAQLTLAVEAPGHWLVMGTDGRGLTADLEKPRGPLTLAVPAGDYTVRLRTDFGVLERRVTVAEHGAVSVRDEELERASVTRVARKGGTEAMLVASASGGVSTGLVSGLGAEPTGSLRLRRQQSVFGPVNEASFGIQGRRASASADDRFLQTELELSAGGGHRFSLWAINSSLSIGLEAGALFVWQNELPDHSSRFSFGLVAWVPVELRVKLVGPLQLCVLAAPGGALVKKASGVSAVPRLTAALGVGFSF